MIRVVIPAHLRTLANVEGEVTLDVKPPITIASILDALENRFPMLKGTIREHATLKRRAFLRYYACQEDLSLHPTDIELPAPIQKGQEPFLIIGSIAGG